MRAIISSFASLVIAVTASPALGQVAQQTGQYQDWVSYAYRDDGGPVCYASSAPAAFHPAEGVNHGDIFFIVTHKPGQNVPHEPSFRAVGFDFEQGSQVRVTIGDRSFAMMTDGGWAWIENAAEEPQLIEAMRAGSEMQVAARSSRPRDVRYTFSLRGVTAAIEAINNCE